MTVRMTPEQLASQERLLDMLRNSRGGMGGPRRVGSFGKWGMPSMQGGGVMGKQWNNMGGGMGGF